MQIRCQRCHRPFAWNRETVIAVLERMNAEGLTHYDADCPHCGKANHVSRQELERWVPAARRQKDKPAAK